MNDRFIVTFDKSQEDIPVLTVARENQFASVWGGNPISIVSVITGNRAVELYNELSNKKVAVVKKDT